MTRKVLAYITRQRGGEMQLLVFEHVDFPEAGVQVPKGTVESGEAIERAAQREVREETGLSSLDRLMQIGMLTQTVFGEPEEWNFFVMSVDGNLPDTWENRVSGKCEDEGIRFRYFWLPLNPSLELAGRQHEGLGFLIAHMKVKKNEA